MYQKTNFKYFIQGLMLTLLLFAGCDGGSTKVVKDSTDDSDNTPSVTHGTFKYSRISIAGSSITHGAITTGANEGDGYLGEKSYVGYVEHYFREMIADTIGPDELPATDGSYTELMSYGGKIMLYNAGTVLRGTLKASDEISIVFAGGDQEVKISLEVEGKKYFYTIPTGNYTPVKKVYDDTNVDFYKAFRENNPQAVKTWKLAENKPHNFILRVEEGILRLNFITNHMYWFQNAGVGGFEAKDFLSEYRQHSTYKDIVTFDPDLFIFESSTNDAKTWLNEINKTYESTNYWLIDSPVDFTLQSNGKILSLPQAVHVQQGDIVVMGEYAGDIQNMAVGIIAHESSGTSVVLSKVITYEGQKPRELDYVPESIVKKCSIKRITTWEQRVKAVMEKVENGVGHHILMGIGTSGVPNYYKPGTHPPESESPNTPRRLLGYREKGKMLAEKNGWFFVDFFKEILSIEPGVDSAHKWSYGDNTHPNEDGRTYFGEAVIKAIPK